MSTLADPRPPAETRISITEISSEENYGRQSEHGLTYDPDFISSLPVLSPPSNDPLTPSSSQPIRALTASQFSQIHLRYALSHAPDSVLFPFLHGLEDGSDALRAFFGSSSSRPGGVKIPNFRGLVWVSTDEPDALRSHHSRRPSGSQLPNTSGLSSLGGYDDGYGYGHPYDDEDEEDEEDDYDSDDYADEEGADDMDIDTDDRGHRQGKERQSSHIQMHPVHHRSTSAPSTSPIPFTPDATSPSATPTPTSSANQTHDRRASTTSQSTVSSSYTTSSSYSSSGVSSVPTSVYSASPPNSPICPPDASLFNTECQSPSHAPARTHVNFSELHQKTQSPHPHPPPSPYPEPPPFFLTSTFFQRDLIKPKPIPKRVTSAVNVNDAKGVKAEERWEYEYEFAGANVPEGISLRNFGVQVPIYATISDIVVYSPTGNTGHALLLAERFREAVDRKREHRQRLLGDAAKDLVPYNVFVLDASPSEARKELQCLLMRQEDELLSDSDDESEGRPAECDRDHRHGKVNGTAHTDSTDAHVVGEMELDAEPEKKSKKKMLKANTIDFAQREKEEMRDLTKASEIFSWFPAADKEKGKEASASSPQTYWNPLVGQVFLGNSNDVPLAPEAYPHSQQRRQDEELFDFTDNDPKNGFGYDVCVQCHDAAPFPTTAHLRAAEDHLAALESMWVDKWLQKQGGDEVMKDVDEKDVDVPPRPPPNANAVIHLPFPSSPPATAVSMSAIVPFIAFLEQFLRPADHAADAETLGETPTSHARSVSGSSGYISPPLAHRRSRPLKVLIHSSDGYTESSVLALALLMALRKLTLPEAYLELQVEKKRSFFVYQGDLAVLKRVETRFEKDRQVTSASGKSGAAVGVVQARYPPRVSGPAYSSVTLNGRPAANSVSISTINVPQVKSGHDVEGDPASPQSAPALSSSSPSIAMMAPWHNRNGQQIRRPRASTSPALPTFIPNHDTWFNDARFDGSFPSRVLPFLYLGNLNHATNAYMLHALGITHVVSVGECALVPPPNFPVHAPAPADKGCPMTPGKGPGSQGSLWIEEKEGRIKVLDIKGVCDDGIDTLAPQLEPICEWIEKARLSGGQVLVHCRVGVSRSATVTIAYVMKHLGLPLVDAYLIVRSRRLSVLIQPNMRLLYNLLGWEVKLARERAGDDEEKLRNELARSLNWPYLAREVHTLNEKYLH